MKRIAGNLLLLCALAASVDEADVQRGAEYTDIVIRKDSDPRAVASSACRDSVFESCESLVLSAIQLEKNRLFGHLLVNWSRSDICGCVSESCLV